MSITPFFEINIYQFNHIHKKRKAWKHGSSTKKCVWYLEIYRTAQNTGDQYLKIWETLKETGYLQELFMLLWIKQADILQVAKRRNWK